MSDAVERAAETIDHLAFSVDWSKAHDPRDREQGERRRGDALRAAQRLADAGLLATDEHDREVGARALRECVDPYLPDLLTRLSRLVKTTKGIYKDDLTEDQFDMRLSFSNAHWIAKKSANWIKSGH